MAMTEQLSRNTMVAMLSLVRLTILGPWPASGFAARAPAGRN